ncbi:MAG: hypothetical protein ACYS5F_15425 [Planctomycetota bacterium]|jgi:hypothetical protein
MKRNIALVDKYPNGYRDKIAYHREQGNDEKVKYFEEKQRQLNESKCIQVLEFMGYENRGKYGTNHLDVLTAIAGKIHKVDEEVLRVQFRALVDTDHNQLKSLLYEHREMYRQDFIDEVYKIINSEKLMQ